MCAIAAALAAVLILMLDLIGCIAQVFELSNLIIQLFNHLII